MKTFFLKKNFEPFCPISLVPCGGNAYKRLFIIVHTVSAGQEEQNERKNTRIHPPSEVPKVIGRTEVTRVTTA